MEDWPENDDTIIGVAHNGEAPAELTYQVGETLYRVNPTGAYALYWSGKAWRESASVRNDWLTGGAE